MVSMHSLILNKNRILSHDDDILPGNQRKAVEDEFHCISLIQVIMYQSFPG